MAIWGKHSSVNFRCKSRDCSKDYASSVWTAFECCTRTFFRRKTDILLGNVAVSDICRTCCQVVGNAKIRNFPRKSCTLRLLEDALGILNSELSLGMPHFGGEAQTPKITDSLGIQHFTPKNRQYRVEYPCKFKTGLTVNGPQSLTPYETKPHMKQHCCCTQQGHPWLAISTAVAAENPSKDDDVSCRVCFVLGEIADPKLMKDG